MSEQALLLPPATPHGDTHGGGFDLKAHAEGLRNTPKEHYAQAAEPDPAPPPPPDPEPTPPPGAQEEPKSTADDGASARFIIDMYDAGVSKLSEALVDDPTRYPAKHFGMEPMLKAHAVTQLEKGMLAGGGKWNMPWWVALLIVLLFHGGLTWMAVRSAKRERADRKQADAERKATSRTAAPPPPPPPTPTVTLHDQQGRAIKTVSQPPRTHGPCAQCGQPVKRAGRKYCSQSCAGLATSARRKTTTSEPSAPTNEQP